MLAVEVVISVIFQIYFGAQPTEFRDGLDVKSKMKRVLDYMVLGLSY